jgi:hypothetical protein
LLPLGGLELRSRELTTNAVAMVGLWQGDQVRGTAGTEPARKEAPQLRGLQLMKEGLCLNDVGHRLTLSNLLKEDWVYRCTHGRGDWLVC